jgi:predicted transcriptional regulator
MLKRKFAIALASAGIKQAEWARRNKLTEAALSQLLSGKMKSKRISALVDNFISDQFIKLKIKSHRAA